MTDSITLDGRKSKCGVFLAIFGDFCQISLLTTPSRMDTGIQSVAKI